jgi:DNA polymerase III delta prime subunit
MIKTNTNDFLWVEKYRPSTIDDFILADDVKELLMHYIETKNIDNLILYGNYGTGKTSIVRFLTDTLGVDYKSINASEARGIDVIRDVVQPFVKTSSFSDFKIFIFNEGEKLTLDAQESLKELTEEYHEHCKFIFTTNNLTKINDGLKSRFKTIHVRPHDSKEVARRLYSILKKENVKASKTDVMTLVDRHFPDVRKIIREAQSFSITGELVIKRMIEKDVHSNIVSVLKETKKNSNIENSWKSIRSLISTMNYDELTELITVLYERCDEYLPDGLTKAMGIIQIAEYARTVINCIDIQVHISGLISELLILNSEAK